MIELPAGGLKWKIGQKGTLNGHPVHFAPDYRSWSWFYVVPMEPSIARFTELVAVATEFGSEIAAMRAQLTCPASREGAFVVEVPKSLVKDIQL